VKIGKKTINPIEFRKFVYSSSNQSINNMKDRKKLNLGYSDFKNIILSNSYFVDKSLLIKEVIDTEKNVLLFPRPRRFGKTLNLSMLKYFFDKSEIKNRKLFEKLKVWQTEDYIKDNCGKYPVISLSFKDAKANNWNETFKYIKKELSKAYEEHYYLFENDILRSYEKTKFEKIITETGDSVDFAVSIKQLSEYLQRYHNEKVVILIDEYDTPIQAGYEKFYEEVVSFMRNLLSGAFKDNSTLYKGIITGILRVSKESIFSGLNNLSVFSILDNQFSDKFGFTEKEVKEIIKDFEVKTKYSQIKKWYNGYQFGRVTDIYNPWSILNYVLHPEDGFKTFWTNTSANELIKNEIKKKDADNIRQEILKLINNEIIVKSIEENFVFTDLDTPKEILWTLLAHSGYLTIRNQVRFGEYELKIPNYELKIIFKKTIIEWIEIDIKIIKSLIQDTANNLINNNISDFEKGLKK